MKIVKIITGGYVSFKVEVSQFEYEEGPFVDPKKRTWAATIKDYISLIDYKRSFFPFTNLEIEVNKLSVGDVINLRNNKFFDENSCLRCDMYFLITNISSTYVEVQQYDTLVNAIQAQNNMNSLLNPAKTAVVSQNNVPFVYVPFRFK